MNAGVDGVFVLWPEQKFVRPAQISSWYSDAVANEELDEDVGIPDDQWKKQAFALHKAGSITLQRW
jgi:hypothetical protein